MNKADIVVVGAGVVGITTAYYLMREGYAVHVVDKHHQAAEGCSFANGGFLSLGHALPWAQPGIAKVMLQSLLQADAPARWRFDGSALQLKWLWQFLRQSGIRHSTQNRQALYQLAAYSKHSLQAVLDEHDFVALSPSGVLQISQHPHARDAFEKQHQSYQGTQVRSQMLADINALASIEPAFSHHPIGSLFGLNILDDYAADCHEFTCRMAQYLMTQGVKFSWGMAVRDIRPTSNGVVVRTEQGELHAEQTVVCAGVDSSKLLKNARDLMVYPIKGYALSAPIIDGTRAPSHPIVDADHRIAISRLGTHIRLTAVAEVVGHNTRIEPHRIEQIKTVYEKLFPHSVDWAQAQSWVGFRPSRPSSVPLIGPCKHKGVFINTGHGALGWTLACGSAKLLVQQLMQQTTAIPVQPYLP